MRSSVCPWPVSTVLFPTLACATGWTPPSRRPALSSASFRSRPLKVPLLLPHGPPLGGTGPAACPVIAPSLSQNLGSPQLTFYHWPLQASLSTRCPASLGSPAFPAPSCPSCGLTGSADSPFVSVLPMAWHRSPPRGWARSQQKSNCCHITAYSSWPRTCESFNPEPAKGRYDPILQMSQLRLRKEVTCPGPHRVIEPARGRPEI